MKKIACKYIISDIDLEKTVKYILKDLVLDDDKSEIIITNNKRVLFKKRGIYISNKIIYLGPRYRNIWLARKYFPSKVEKTHHDAIERCLDLRGEIKSFYCTPKKESIRFIVRVDDFPRWDIKSEYYIKFHHIMAEKKILYMLGVTPFISKNPLDVNEYQYRKLTKKEINIISKIVSEGNDVALHGFTHKTISKKINTELIGLNRYSLEEKISNALKEFSKYGIEPNVFIPPFNTIDIKSVKVLRKYFKAICGGPESIPYLKYRLPFSFIKGVQYIPSYNLAYGTSKKIIKYVEDIIDIHENIIVPLTIHWAWERKDNYNNFDKLCRLIEGKVCAWNDILF